MNRIDIDSNYKDGLMLGAHGQSRVRGNSNRRGIGRVQLMMLVGFMGLAFLMAAPSLVGMIRPKPVDAVGWIADLAEAQGESTKTGKPMIIKFTADWCGPCKMFSREVFSDSQVGKFIRGSFVPVVVDVTDRDSPGQSVANQFEVEGLPTLVVLSAEGWELDRKIGYMDKSALMNWLATY